MPPFLNESDDDVVELDTWSEQEDGVEDPFESEEEIPADEGLDELRNTDGFEAQRGSAARPRVGPAAESPARIAALLKIPRTFR